MEWQDMSWLFCFTSQTSVMLAVLMAWASYKPTIDVDHEGALM